MSSTEKENQVVTGTVTGIIQKGPDRWQVAVMPDGSQYPKHLWSKDQAFIADMSQRIGQRFDFLCGVSHWNRDDGQAVRSLWFNALGAAGSMNQQQQVQQQTQPTYPGQPQQPAQATQTASAPPPATPAARPPVSISEDTRELRIMRQTSMKCAVNMLALLSPEERKQLFSEDSVLASTEMFAEWCLRYFVGGPRSGNSKPGPGEIADAAAAEAWKAEYAKQSQPEGEFPWEDQPNVQGYNEFPPEY